nr:hypothetical protein [Morchella crassipes]
MERPLKGLCLPPPPRMRANNNKEGKKNISPPPNHLLRHPPPPTLTQGPNNPFIFYRRSNGLLGEAQQPINLLRRSIGVVGRRHCGEGGGICYPLLSHRPHPL